MVREKEREKVREKQSDGEGNSNGPWRVVSRRKPSSQWRQGPWPTQNHRRGKWQAKDQGESSWIEDKTFSIFADNLPQDSTKQWLWKVFSSIGRVEDIFIPKKVRHNNPLKFAFIRYRTREEARRTIEHLDGWIVWGCRIRLTEARFRRSETKEKVKGSTHEEDRNKAEMCNQGEKMVRGKTYSEILMNGSKETRGRNIDEGSRIESKIYLEEYKEARERLNRCLVGETLNPFKFEELKNALLEVGRSLVDIKMIGPTKVLLAFPSTEEAEVALDSEVLKNHFLELRKWSIGDTNRL
ncbi:hypothetical protein PIB30_086431 [Stylosanthes scabra]|uniref:RRM domain-containing protein n=1 Tax=Stylosanthes scabra TaxID=79078 RepID=A0ABU6XSY8_9FABA|nr:hypothetical protein [Stylosanthes scabra]